MCTIHEVTINYTEAKKKNSVDGIKHGVLSIYSKFRL